MNRAQRASVDGHRSGENPVDLIGNPGVSVFGFGANFELPYSDRLSFIGRVGLDVMKADALGYFPDSLRNRAGHL